MINQWISFRTPEGSSRLMIMIIIFLSLANIFFGEIVPAGGGFGWDGVIYANMTKNLESLIGEGQLSTYYAHRILPSAVLHYVLLVFNSSFDDKNIILGFQIYNLLLLIATCCIWTLLADHFRMRMTGRWIGFTGLFINFEASKQAFYLPVATDVSALFLAILLVYFYIKRKTIFLFLAVVAGIFTWPLVGICGILLLMLPRVMNTTNESLRSFIKPSRLLIKSWIYLLLVSIFLVVSLKFFVPKVVLSAINDSMNSVADSVGFVNGESLSLRGLITGLPSIALIAYGIYSLIGSSKYAKVTALSLLKSSRLQIVLAVLLLAIPWVIISYIANKSLVNPNSIVWAIHHMFFIPPEGKILLPFVTLGVFWGPVTLLMLLNWDAFCFELRKLGPGLVAIFCLTLPLLLVAEPRYLTLVWPLIVLATSLVMDKLEVNLFFWRSYIFLTVLYAQFWLKINLDTWPADDYEGIMAYPKQVLFMHYGFWMGWLAYAVQLVALVASIWWLKKYLNPRQRV